MSGLGGIARKTAALLFGLVALFFWLIAVSLPSQLQRQAQQDQAYYQQFRQAAAYAAAYAEQHNGQMPPDEELQRLGDSSDASSIWFSLSSSGGECDGGFRRAPTDQFTLWFWRGEWAECFAYPSGQTTLPMSVSAYLRSGLGTQWAIWWLVGLAAAYTAFRLGRRKPPSSVG